MWGGVAKPCKITWYFILGVCFYQLCAHTEQLPFLRAVVFPRTGFALGERIRRPEGTNGASLHELRGILLHVESFSWFLFTAAVMVPLNVREPLRKVCHSEQRGNRVRSRWFCMAYIVTNFASVCLPIKNVLTETHWKSFSKFPWFAVLLEWLHRVF